MSERKAAHSAMSVAHTTKVETMSSVKVVTSWARVADMAACPPTWLDHHTMTFAGALQELCPQWPTGVEMWGPRLSTRRLSTFQPSASQHGDQPPGVARPLQRRNGPLLFLATPSIR